MFTAVSLSLTPRKYHNLMKHRQRRLSAVHNYRSGCFLSYNWWRLATAFLPARSRKFGSREHIGWHDLLVLLRLHLQFDSFAVATRPFTGFCDKQRIIFDIFLFCFLELSKERTTRNFFESSSELEKNANFRRSKIELKRICWRNVCAEP